MYLLLSLKRFRSELRSPACCLTLLFLTIATGLLLGGCAASQLDMSVRSVAPVPFDTDTAESPLQIVLGVDNFVDLRPQTRGSDNKKWMGFIPGILWIEISSDIPEIYTAFSPFNSRPFNFNVAQAIADTIGQSSLCRAVVFLPEDPYRHIDYRLEGVLRRSLVEETGYYYGSGIYAWVTRIFGLPYVSYNMELEVDLRLRSMTTNDVLWKGTIAGTREDKYHNVYGLAEGIDGKHIIAYNFSQIMSEQLPDILSGLRKALEKVTLNGEF
ncbi:MAG: hypothetical protein J7K15_00880 [Deltaproteobacteria bacterium]|nr:hypothetical protein [Deltaproteobacteria bacterium]